MEKIVILVEDEIYPLEEVLLNIQSVLFVASKSGLSNAPQDHDTLIYVLHILDENQEYEKSKERFQRIKRTLENRQQDLRDNRSIPVPDLDYKYDYMRINRKSYPGNCTECAETIQMKIEEIRNNREFAILLDVVLDKEKDTQIVLDGTTKILSQKLYESLNDHCIPYTNYKSGSVTFRQMWTDGISPHKEAFDREDIDGNIINKRFKNELYRMLKIGVDAT